MKLRPLATSRFSVFGVVENGECQAELFLTEGEADTKSWRDNLRIKLSHIACAGLQGIPVAWSHEASKKDQIYELRQGALRLFYFKGVNGQVAICTCGVRKKGQKVDPRAVARAAKMRQEYFEAIQSGTLEPEE